MAMSSSRNLLILFFLIASSLLHAVTGSSFVYADEVSERLKQRAAEYYWGQNRKKDLKKALDLYVQAADRGDSEAKYIAGGMYYKGYGTVKDLTKAFTYLYNAALDGSSTPDSQKLLGQFFLQGINVPKNYSEAMKWYTLAAENGDRDAQSELGFLYYTGKGGERNFAKAFHWYEKSAFQGLAVSQYSLGVMYFSGTGVDTADMLQSYGWFSLAAAQGHVAARQAVEYIESVLSQEELVEAQNLASNLFLQISSK